MDDFLWNICHEATLTGCVIGVMIFGYLNFVSLCERHLGHIVRVGTNLELASLNKIVFNIKLTSPLHTSHFTK